MLSNRFTAGTLLQGHPAIIKGHFRGDVFADLTGRLCHTKLDEPRYGSAHKSLRPSNRAERWTSPLQRPRWSTRGTCSRPGRSSIQLREIYLVWSILGFKFPLIFSGTGINYQIIDETLGSSHLKAQPYRCLHDIGAFDDPHSRAYIQQYFPPSLFQTPAWDAFLSRAWAWLRGRYQALLISWEYYWQTIIYQILDHCSTNFAFNARRLQISTSHDQHIYDNPHRIQAERWGSLSWRWAKSFNWYWSQAHSRK